MPNSWREIHDVDELDTMFEQSKSRLVLLFKHSLTCPVSSRAFREFESFIETAPPLVAFHLIAVQTARSASDEAAARLDLRHETPQAILIRNGREIWNASHYAVNTLALQDAVREALQAATEMPT